MRIPTEAEIEIMGDDTAENTYDQLKKEYEKKFRKAYIAPPGSSATTWQEDLVWLAKYLREGKPSPWTMEDWEEWKDVD